MSPSSTNEMEIFRFFNCFSRIYKNGVRYKAERIEEKADSWPTLTLTSKIKEEKLFHT